MSTSKIFGSSSNDPDEKIFIWLHSVYQVSLDATLTLFTHSHGTTEATAIKSMTSSVLCLSESLNLKKIVTTCFSLSSLELGKFTNDGQKMLSCQVIFH
jgi:hypothetical protein